MQVLNEVQNKSSLVSVGARRIDYDTEAEQVLSCEYAVTIAMASQQVEHEE